MITLTNEVHVLENKNSYLMHISNTQDILQHPRQNPQLQKRDPKELAFPVRRTISRHSSAASRFQILTSRAIILVNKEEINKKQETKRQMPLTTYQCKSWVIRSNLRTTI